MTMTRIERVKTVLAGGVPDQIPVMAHNFMFAAKEFGITISQYRDNPELMAKSMEAAAEKYDLDGIWLDVDTALLASACGADVVYPEDSPAVTKGVQPRAIEDLPKILSEVDILACPRIRNYIEAAEMLVKWGNETDHFIRINADQGAFSLACLVTGMDEFMMDLVDEDYEEDIRNLLEATYAISLRMHELCWQTGAHTTSYGNSSEGCSVVSPAVFRKFSKGLETRLATELKARGIPNICHICGDVNPILPDLLETGCPAYELDWKTDVKRVFELAHGKFALSGNVDPALFVTGTPDDLYAAAKAVCDLYRGKGGLILCSGCALGPNTKAENLAAFVKAGRDHGRT